MALITVSPGPRNAHTDSKTGLRFYRWQGVDYPSVTTIRRMAGLPFFLHQWTLTQVIDRMVNEHDKYHEMLDRPRRPRERVRDKNVVIEVRKWLRAAATEQRDISAKLGTDVHDAATSQRPINDPLVTDEMRPRLVRFYDWLERSGAEVIAVEQQVFNLGLGYAGTFDFICRMPDGRIFIVDLKTGRGTYTEHALQLTAYAMADFVGEDDVINKQLTELLLGASGMALLHIRDDEPAEWQEVRITPVMYDAFKGLLNFAVFVHENQTIDSLVSESQVYEMDGDNAGA